MAERVEVFEGRQRERRFRGRRMWYWRWIAKNGETLCVSESYHNKVDCMMIANRQAEAHDIKVVQIER